MKLDDLLDLAGDDILRCSHRLPDVLRAIRDALPGQPGAQSYDTIGHGRSILWCDLHERELVACHRAGLDCDGETVVVNDPTGEAALEFSQAAVDLRAINRRVRAIAQQADALITIINRWSARSATDSERRATERANEPGCEVCARSDRYTPAKVLSSDVKKNLDRPHRLCTWHHDFVLAHGRLPTTVEEAAHQAGKRVRVRMAS